MAHLVREVMTASVSMLNPTQTLQQAAQAMREQDIGILPVAENERLIGMLSDRDIVTRAVAEGRNPASTKVRDAMSDKLLYCFDDQPCSDVAANMGENQVRRLPVVNRDKRLVGIVSLGDLSVKGEKKAAGEALEDISKPA